MGQRTQIARGWVEFLEDASKSKDRQVVLEAVETAIESI